jgi:hypothetical protein
LDGDPRQWFTFQTLGTTYTGDEDHPEVHIKSMSGWCLTRHESAVFMDRHCDPEDSQQRFFALNGSFAGTRFEIGQYEGYTLNNCLTVRSADKVCMKPFVRCRSPSSEHPSMLAHFQFRTTTNLRVAKRSSFMFVNAPGRKTIKQAFGSAID